MVKKRPSSDVLCKRWLVELKDLMAVHFADKGYPIQNYVYVAYNLNWKELPHVGATCTYIPDGNCYYINISPHKMDSLRVAGVLCHELIHTLGTDAKTRKWYFSHSRKFGKVCKEMGLLKPWTATTESFAFTEWANPLIDKIGREFPHPDRWRAEHKSYKHEPAKWYDSSSSWDYQIPNSYAKFAV